MKKQYSASSLTAIFNDVEFIKSVFSYVDLPNNLLKEIAFCGKSNVGKSSLLNAILNSKKICHTSNTPGRTQSLNFLLIGKQIYLVDLPGYGYAEAPKAKIKAWTQLIDLYLQERPNLKRVFLLIDSRRSVQENDFKIMKMLDKYAVSYQLILTKIDKISNNDLNHLKNSLKLLINDHPAMHNDILFTSSTKWIGIQQLRLEIAQFI